MLLLFKMSVNFNNDTMLILLLLIYLLMDSLRFDIFRPLTVYFGGQSQSKAVPLSNQ